MSDLGGGRRTPRPRNTTALTVCGAVASVVPAELLFGWADKAAAAVLSVVQIVARAGDCSDMTEVADTGDVTAAASASPPPLYQSTVTAVCMVASPVAGRESTNCESSRCGHTGGGAGVSAHIWARTTTPRPWSSGRSSGLGAGTVGG